MLGEKGLPFVLVFTKADKQSSIKTDQNVAKFRKALLASFEEVPDIFITSSEEGLGKDEVLNFVHGINQNFEIPEYKNFDE